jgi:hypothetical protein
MLILAMEIYGLLKCAVFCCFCQLALELVEHLRAMGETNALFQRNPVSILHAILVS